MINVLHPFLVIGLQPHVLVYAEPGVFPAPDALDRRPSPTPVSGGRRDRNVGLGRNNGLAENYETTGALRLTIASRRRHVYDFVMSATAEAFLEQFRKLPLPEQEELLGRLRELIRSRPTAEKPFPTLRLRGGTITSEQVAEALDDE